MAKDDDDDISLGSSASSSSDESSVADSAKTSKEAAWESYFRQSVFFGLILVAASVIIATFVLVVDSDNANFRHQFATFVERIHQDAILEDRNTLESLKSLSEAVTMQGGQAKSWPLVMIDHFEMQAQHVRSVTGAETIVLSPIVQTELQAQWEQFSVIMREHVTYNPTASISSQIYYLRQINESQPVMHVPEWNSGPYNPVWQMSPPPSNTSVFNYNMLSDDHLKRLFNAMLHSREAVASPLMDLSAIDPSMEQRHTAIFSPVFSELFHTDTSEIVANLAVIISWDTYLSFLDHDGIKHAHYVLQSTCGDLWQFDMVDGQLGPFTWGDDHNQLYEKMMGVVPLLENMKSHYNSSAEMESCAYDLYIYPTQAMRDDFKSQTAGIMTAVVTVAFIAVVVIFIAQDRYMERKNQKIVKSVEKSNAIIASLFPSNVRDRLFGQNGDDTSKGSKGSKSRRSFGFRLRTYLTEGGDAANDGDNDNPIADLFPACTVLFADIVGFTAWSSMREPAQVFTLLETLYSAFDELAKELGVFKVETIGDCYVAVTGLPDPRDDHAVVMAIFARECFKKMQVLTKELEVKLGPDTGDLSMRFGLHSGPVTAGVLRGERSRFQLFGDTVNTAARIESTGQRGRIHLSEECAHEIMNHQKAHWVQPREDKVEAKGKGELQTYWLGGPGTHSQSSATSSHTGGSLQPGTVHDGAMKPLPKIPRKKREDKQKENEESQKKARLVDWNVDILQRLLKQIAARAVTVDEEQKEERAKEKDRKKMEDPALKPLAFQVTSSNDSSNRPKKKDPDTSYHSNDNPDSSRHGSTSGHGTNTSRHRSFEIPAEISENQEDGTRIYTDEVAEIIPMPKFDSKAVRKWENADDIDLGFEAVDQLHDFVETIASLYRDNSFHNFEHASHVTMSTVKLLSRIVAPDLDIDEHVSSSERKRQRLLQQRLHDHTYGITSDPLTQFAVVFSALIHDVDHTGVPNTQLIVEQPALAKRFRSESVAEQHSVAVSWDLLMQPRFAMLRKAIYRDTAERDRFLQLVINCVMATDIVNKELKELRNARWDKAFNVSCASATDDDINRKATIVIEHIIQASDVSHTMQHWHIYRKWNERLFRELYYAWRDGRAEKSPATFWAKGEVGFFDFYIIPLAKKLKDCGVFGVSSDEYLNYAMKNRNEWESKGEAIVKQMLEDIEREEM